MTNPSPRAQLESLWAELDRIARRVIARRQRVAERFRVGGAALDRRLVPYFGAIVRQLEQLAPRVVRARAQLEALDAAPPADLSHAEFKALERLAADVDRLRETLFAAAERVRERSVEQERRV